MSESRRGRLRGVRLYALLAEEQCRRPWLETARLLLEGGVHAIQLREKGLCDRELLHRARVLLELTRRYSVLLIINDRPDVALLAGADGVHLGQDDLPPREVRRLVGEDLIIGVSTHTPAQARAADCADYIGVGPVFPTTTRGYEQGGGAALVSAVCRAASVPTVAIGGITPRNAHVPLGAGARAVAACAALCGAEDPAEAARAFLEALDKGEGLRE